MEEKLSLLKELIKLAQSDHELREKEYIFLLSVAESLDVSKEVFDTLFEMNIELKAPASEFDRILQFHRMILLMNIDQDTNEKEIKFVKDIGIRLGLSPLATNQVIREMDKYPNKVIPAERLIEIFKKQYN